MHVRQTSERMNWTSAKNWTIRLSVASLVLIGAIGCSRPAGMAKTAKSTKESSKDTKTDRPTEKTATESPPLPVLMDVPKFRFVDQDGQKFGTDELQGQVWVANFMFTRCTATCPRQTAKFEELQQAGQRWPDKGQLRLISFTVDPEHDTVSQLKDYADLHHADPALWKFLTGSRADLWTLCSEGFKLPVAESSTDTASPITHSPRFVLIDKQHRIRGFYDGLDPEEFRKMLVNVRTLLSEPTGKADEALHVAVPKDVFNPPWIETRATEQRAKANQMRVNHDFIFTDQVETSGIRFLSRAVGDATKHFRPNHYDHGNGIAVADVDGDGLTDIYFVNQIGGNELWHNMGSGQFEDMTAAAGVALKGKVCVSAAFADTDNDGDVDLYVTTTRHGNAFFENDGHGRFRDVTADAGLTQVAHSSSADFFDFDRDGRLDLFVTNVGTFTTDKVMQSEGVDHQQYPYYTGIDDSFSGHLFPHRFEQSVLYHNDGGNRFSDVSEKMGLVHKKWSGDATPLDFNQDGWIDLYVVNMQGNDEYYENIKGEKFECRSAEVFPYSVWGGMCAKSFDYNNDGLMDLFVTNMHADMWKRGDGGNLGPIELEKAPQDVLPESMLKSRKPGMNVLGNGFYEKRGTEFHEVSDKLHTETFWPWGHSAGDLNADGFQDLFITASMNYPFRYHHNSLLLNDRGERFHAAEFILGAEPRREGRTATAWFDLECGGLDAAQARCKDCRGHMTVWAAVGTRSSVLFDLDQDGDLDIVTNDFNSAPMVLISNLNERNKELSYLKIRLQGTRSNKSGLGALVQLTVDGKKLTQVNDGQSGYLSQSDLPLYFGLGGAKTIDQIEVLWPSGHKQLINGPVAPNQERLIIEAETR